MKLNDQKKKTEVLAIIPARGGSKGIPRKNIIDLCSKPLIAYTIEVALNAKLVDRVIVSTEDEEIAEISRCYGAEVPFLRPKELAGDDSSLNDVMAFTLDKLKSINYRPRITAHLFPTHIFRTPELMDFLVGKLIDGYSYVRTVRKITHSPNTVFFKEDNGQLVSLLDPDKKTIESKTFFRSYGTFIGFNAGGNQKVYNHTVKNPIELIDIDTYSDLYFAEEVIKNKMFNFNINDNPHKYEDYLN